MFKFYLKVLLIKFPLAEPHVEYYVIPNHLL